MTTCNSASPLQKIRNISIWLDFPNLLLKADKIPKPKGPFPKNAKKIPAPFKIKNGSHLQQVSNLELLVFVYYPVKGVLMYVDQDQRRQYAATWLLPFLGIAESKTDRSLL